MVERRRLPSVSKCDYELVKLDEDDSSCNKPSQSSSIDADSNDSEKKSWSRKQIVLLVTILMTHFISNAAAAILVPFYPQEAQSKGLTSSDIGMIFSSYYFVLIIFGPIYGSLVSFRTV